MKHSLLILSFLLSWLFSGSEAASSRVSGSSETSVVQASSQEQAPDFNKFNTLCLTSARGVSFSGETNSFTPTVRTLNSGRRVQPSSKTSFRVVKAGKVVDRQTFHTFLEVLYHNPSGLFCIDRYIYAIEHLLI